VVGVSVGADAVELGCGDDEVASFDSEGGVFELLEGISGGDSGGYVFVVYAQSDWGVWGADLVCPTEACSEGDPFDVGGEFCAAIGVDFVWVCGFRIFSV